MLLSNLNLLATAPGGVAKLRELILTLAVQGKLVAQDPKDEPASVLLNRVSRSATQQNAKTLKVGGAIPERSAPYALPATWKWSRLGDLVENMGSGWSPACDEGERSDPARWAVLRTTAVQVNEYRASEHKAIPSTLSPRPEIEVKDGDILVTRAGPMNRVGISCWVNNTPPRLMLSDKIVRFHSIADEMLPVFIVLTLNGGWTKNQIEKAKTGMAASQVNISQTDLRGLWLPVCSRAEQSRIVTRVEELMRLCDALEAKGQLEATQHAQLVSTLLGTLTESETPEELADHWQRVATHFDLLLDRPEAVDALEQTILQLAVRGLLVPQDPQDEPASELLKKIRVEKARLVDVGKIKRDKPLAPIADDEKPFQLPRGWEWVSMGELVNSSEAGWSPTCHGSPRTHGKWGVLKVSAISWGSFDPEANKELPADLPPKPEYEVNDGDFLLSRANTAELVARSVVVRAAQPKLMLSDKIIRLDVSSQVNRELLNLCNNSDHARVHYIANASGTSSSMKNVSREVVLKVPTPLPPLAEQSRIVARVAALRALCADLRQRLAAASERQSQLAQSLVEMQSTTTV
jgi:type I restriction enzyme S subunit